MQQLMQKFLSFVCLTMNFVQILQIAIIDALFQAVNLTLKGVKGT